MSAWTQVHSDRIANDLERREEARLDRLDREMVMQDDWAIRVEAEIEAAREEER